MCLFKGFVQKYINLMDKLMEIPVRIKMVAENMCSFKAAFNSEKNTDTIKER